MLYYLTSRTDAVQCVEDLLMISSPDLQSITVTKLGTSEDYCVSGVINTLSDDIVDQTSKRLDELYPI